MLEAYREHAAVRAADSIPPKPLDAQQTVEPVELLKQLPKGEQDFLPELLTRQVPAGVDEAAWVKAGFLAAIFGTIPSMAEYLHYAEGINTMADHVYRYLNFNAMENYSAAAESAVPVKVA